LEVVTQEKWFPSGSATTEGRTCHSVLAEWHMSSGCRRPPPFEIAGPLRLPGEVRVTEAEEIVADPDRSPDLADADRVFLRGWLAGLWRAIEDRGAVEQLIHSGPHPGNVLSTSSGPLFIDLEPCCRGPVEFDLAHVPAAVCDHYPGVDQELLAECRQLVIAMVAAWRWDAGEQFPRGRRFGEELLRALREGPPWPTLDTVVRRRDGPSSEL